MSDRILLIDLSSIAHQQWHLSGNDPNPDATALKTVERVRALASGTTSGVAICCDAPPYFRKDIDPAYKANRAKDNNAVIAHQIDLVKDTLKTDGFPVWAVQGFEADDVIATAVHEHLLADSGDITVASADKDLLQLVSDRVTVKSTHSSNDLDPEAVKEKLGVWPHQVVDYLSLVGDTSDNVTGAKGIGAKRAAEILETFGNLDDAIKAANESGDESAVTKSLREFKDRVETVRSLIRLRTDVPLPFEEIFKEREPVETSDDEREAAPEVQRESTPEVSEGIPRGGSTSAGSHESTMVRPVPSVDRTGSMVARVPEVIDHAPVAFEQQLEPRNMQQVDWLAKQAFASKLFGQTAGSAQAALMVMLAGREYGMTAMASLRAFHIIEGKPALAADTIRALVLRSGKCEYFRCTERTAERATFVTKRNGDPELAMSFSIQEAQQAWTKDERAWKSSAWGKHPADMLVARCTTKLARLVYPDVVHGFYSPEEL